MDTNSIQFSIFVKTNPLDIPSCSVAFIAAPLGQHECSPENAQMKASDVSSPTLDHHY
jgi:hypothetical protein